MLSVNYPLVHGQLSQLVILNKKYTLDPEVDLETVQVWLNNPYSAVSIVHLDPLLMASKLIVGINSANSNLIVA